VYTLVTFCFNRAFLAAPGQGDIEGDTEIVGVIELEKEGEAVSDEVMEGVSLGVAVSEGE